MAVFGVFMLAGPLLLLAIAFVELWSFGPVGWCAAVALLVAVVAGSWLCVRTSLRWWRGTKVAARPQVRPADARRLPR